MSKKQFKKMVKDNEGLRLHMIGVIAKDILESIGEALHIGEAEAWAMAEDMLEDAFGTVPAGNN